MVYALFMDATQTKYFEKVRHLAACQGVNATDRAIAMCYKKTSATNAAKLISLAMNGYAGERAYTWLGAALMLSVSA